MLDQETRRTILRALLLQCAATSENVRNQAFRFAVKREMKPRHDELEALQAELLAEALANIVRVTPTAEA